MKTKFYYLPILLLGGLSLFTACSDDDDENGGGQPSAPVIGSGGTNSGARLTSISDDWGNGYYFQYNEDGMVQRISKGDSEIDYDWIAMTYNPFRMETYEWGELKNTSFNQNGYLTHFKAEGTYSDEEYDYWEKYKEDYSYSYNGNGNLTRIVDSYSYNGVRYNGENYSGHGTYTATFTWSEGNLTRLEFVFNWVEDGKTGNKIETYDFEYTDEINKYKQYVIGLYKHDNYECYEDLLVPVGWLGKWTKNYPASFVYKSIEEGYGGIYEKTRTGTWSDFSTTSDGLLSGFNYGGTRYTYTYDNTAPTAKKAAAKQMLDNNAPSPRTKKMSRRHLHHARMLNRK